MMNKKLLLNVICIGLMTTYLGCGELKERSQKALPEVSVTAIYNFLKENYPQYKDITYGEPTNNILRSNNWLLQTPNIWRFTIDQYNTIFPGDPDPCFNLPKCAETPQVCQGGLLGFPAQCVVPNFLAQNAAIGCPNNTSVAAGTPLCLSNAHKILTDMYDAIVNATFSVDITSLNEGSNFLTAQELEASGRPSNQQKPDAFFFVLKQAFTELSKRSASMPNGILVRFIGGAYSNDPITASSAQNFLKALTANFDPNNKLTIVAVSERSCPTIVVQSLCDTPFTEINDLFKGSWNHGKNIVVDQKILFVGGENLWGNDYTSGNPTNDLHLRMEGRVAQGATIYNNEFFKYLTIPRAVNFFNQYANQCWVYRNGAVESSFQRPCNKEWITNVSNQTVTFLPEDKSIQAMYISKLSGLLGEMADQSSAAAIISIMNARSSVKIAQQSLFVRGVDPRTLTPLTNTFFPADPGPINNPIGIMYAIATVFSNNIENNTNIPVNILTSSVSPNGAYNGYGADVDLSYIYKFICKLLIRNFQHTASEAQTQLSSNLKLGYVSYNKQQASNGEPTHHSKFWMVDDHLFYVGSHNFYPASLQEFGVIIDSVDAANELNSQFWNPLWGNADTSISAFNPAQNNCNNL